MAGRWGKRGVGGDLEYDKDVTIKSINKYIYDIGFEIKWNGWDEWRMPTYSFRKHKRSKVTHKLKDSVVKVYALGDYSIEEWRTILYRRLRETNPRFEKAAWERVRKKKRRREAAAKRLEEEKNEG